jgi:hypothetical protein
MSDGSVSSNGPVIEAPRYGFGVLLLAVAAVAVSLALMRSWGIFGAACVFGLALILSAVATAYWSRGGVRLAFDLTWGIVIPVICLAYDPGIFREGSSLMAPMGPPKFDPSAWGPQTVLIYASLGYQMLLLASWIGWGHAIRHGGGFVAGGLWVGFLAAILIGLVLFIPAMFGLIVGIGAMGFAPWLTAYVFYRRAVEAQRSSSSAAEGMYLWRLGGSATALLIPELTVWLVHGTSGFAQLTKVFF